MAEEYKSRERWDFRQPNMMQMNRVLEASFNFSDKEGMRRALLFWWKALKPYQKGTDKDGRAYDVTKRWAECGKGETDEQLSEQLACISEILHRKDLLLEEFLSEGPSE